METPGPSLRTIPPPTPPNALPSPMSALPRDLASHSPSLLKRDKTAPGSQLNGAALRNPRPLPAAAPPHRVGLRRKPGTFSIPLAFLINRIRTMRLSPSSKRGRRRHSVHFRLHRTGHPYNSQPIPGRPQTPLGAGNVKATNRNPTMADADAAARRPRGRDCRSRQGGPAQPWRPVPPQHRLRPLHLKRCCAQSAMCQLREPG